MDYVLLLWFTLALFSTGFCATIQRNHSEPEAVTVRGDRSGKAILRDFLACGVARDVSCFLDVADVLVEEKKNDLLAQADQEALKATGRADEESSPSQLSKSISKIISELTEMFREGLFGFFKSAREGEDGDEIDESEESDDSAKQVPKIGEARGKKKKEKLIALIKLIIIGILLKVKITLLLKILSAALQVKFFLVALAGLILNAARFYLDLKHKKQPQKVIYYEHAQHQHHYEGDDDWSSSSPGGGYWGRSYDEEGETSAQDLAYAKQRPYKKINNDKSDFSWFG